ncbi:hypothetical protein [Bacillus thuringiensis]|uniref:hypothetical protein n=1 Tax=Bacillus thuringiensis TaxID=1428 RepID=UPI000BFE41A7|nr:hypothetical protein [Bacillus thuringiensis]PGT89924.1 hypothetical protein COD17_09240 [Bacillus thuringiensis]
MSENKQTEVTSQTEQTEVTSQPKKKGLKALNKKQKNLLIVGVALVIATGVSVGWGLSNTNTKKDTKAYAKKDVQAVENSVKEYDKGLDIKLDDETKKLMDAEKTADKEKAENKKEEKDNQNKPKDVPLSPASTKAKMLVSKVSADNGEVMKSTANELEKVAREVLPHMQSDEIRNTSKTVPEMQEFRLAGMSLVQEYMDMAKDLRATADKLANGTDEEKERVPEVIEGIKKRADNLKEHETEYAEAKEKASHVKAG